MTLMRFDPFRDLDRIMEQNVGSAPMPRSMPLTALRRGDTFLIDLDLAGVNPDDVDLTVERNVLTIRAQRSATREADDEVIIDERRYGEVFRQLFLGENLEPAGLSAELRDGVLRVTIPVSEASKPRRIPLSSPPSGEAATVAGG